MRQRLIYLQQGFWESIKNDETIEGRKIFWDLYSALQLCDICADIPEEVWYEKDDPLYYLIQDSVDGYGTQIDMNNPDKISSALLKNNEQSIDNLCAIYLLDENENKCIEYGNLLGILCLNSKMIRNNCSYVLGTAIEYKKNEDYDNYKKIQDLFSPCNSIIIIDPYILKGNSKTNTNSIEINLVPLLDRIMPQKLCIPFHLSIFSQAYGCVTESNINANSEEVYQYIEEQVRSIRPQLKISLSLYNIKTTGDGDGDFHSRHILTNCMSVNSEDGFDLFKNKTNWRTKTTKCVCGKYARIEFIHPTLSDNRRLEASSYNQWIKIASINSVDAHSRNPNNCWGWGTLENRLFDLVGK